MQYPLVEIATGFVFISILNQSTYFTEVSALPATQIFNSSALVLSFLDLLFLFYIASSFIVIFVYDLKHYLIPDKVLFGAIAITFLYQLAFDFKFLIFNSLWASLGSFLFFWLIFFVSKEEWMGFGDCKLAVLLGLVLGFPGILLGLFLIIDIIASYYLIYIPLKKK